MQKTGSSSFSPIFTLTVLPSFLHTTPCRASGRAVQENKIIGENLNVIIGGMPVSNDNKEAVKAGIIKLLKSMNIEEEDFISAEIEVVPACRASGRAVH